MLPEEKHRVCDWFFLEGKPAEYVYDFGDDWVHAVKLEKILPAEEGVDYPRCLKGKRACPPEDCGGPWGYQHLLEVLADPRHEEHEEMLEWVGGGFEPELFHPDGVVFLDPDKLRGYREGGGGSSAARGGGGATGEEELEDPCVRDLLERVQSEGMPLASYQAELDALLPNSILAAVATVEAVVEKHGRGEITREEAEEVIREQADLHPMHPFLFELCLTYALPRMDELEILGYTALAMIKLDRWEEMTGERCIDEMPEELRKIMELVGDNDYLLEASPYIEKCGDHLVKHFLVEDILESDWEMDEGELKLVLERGERVMPVVIAMCADLLEGMDADLLPYGFVYLLRLIGCLKPREALPVLMRALEVCGGESLHEAVLALAKLGSQYPEEVSGRLRDVAGDPAYREVRLAAVEALGLLGRAAGNAGFLREALQGLDPEDPDYHEMFVFLVQALASACGEEAPEVIGAALEEHRPFLPADTADFARAFLENPEFTGLGCRLEDFLEEDIFDLRELELDSGVYQRRATMTLAREEELEELYSDMEEDEEWLPDLDWVEEQLRKGRNEPCPCGSGLKFKKCCLPRLKELRDILARGEELEEGEPNPQALLMSRLEDFARRPSLALERNAARDEFLEALGRARFGESGIEGADMLEEAVFDDWFLFSRPLSASGKRVIEEFDAAHGSGLDEEQASMLRIMINGRFSIYEIESIGAGGMITLRDVFRDQRFEMPDELLGSEAAEGDLLGGFLGHGGEHYELFGSVMHVPGEFLEELERFVRSESGRCVERGETGDMNDFLQRSGFRVLFEVLRLYESRLH